MWGLLLLLLLLLLLFVFLDVWYFIRTIPLVFALLRRNRGRRKFTREALLSTTTVDGIVMPSDLDFMFHMNNSKYLREMDFARFSHFFKTNFYYSARVLGVSLVVAANMIRYRRSLHLWQKFQLQTRILAWDDSSLYVEQRFVDKQGFVCAIALLKQTLRGMTVSELLERACVEGHCQSPPVSPELLSLTEAIKRSSESLKRE